MLIHEVSWKACIFKQATRWLSKAVLSLSVAHHKLGANHVVRELILLCTCKDKQDINLALCPHAAKDVLHEMGLATCRLAVYADDEKRTEVFHSWYTMCTNYGKPLSSFHHQGEKEAMNEQLMAE